MKQPNEKQREKIKAKYKAVEQAQAAFQAYLQGVGDMCELDETKQYEFDFQKLEFIEKEQDA